MRYLLIGLVLLMGCQQVDTTTNTEEVSRNITFFKYPTKEICFAALNSSTYAGYQTVSITEVDCTKVGL